MLPNNPPVLSAAHCICPFGMIQVQKYWAWSPRGISSNEMNGTELNFRRRARKTRATYVPGVAWPHQYCTPPNLYHTPPNPYYTPPNPYYTPPNPYYTPPNPYHPSTPSPSPGDTGASKRQPGLGPIPVLRRMNVEHERSGRLHYRAAARVRVTVVIWTTQKVHIRHSISKE